MPATPAAAARRGLPDRLWPSADQELLLKAVFGSEEAAREAWAELRSGFDLDRMEDGSFALMPLLYRRIETWELDDPLVPRLKGLYRHSWYRGNVLLERLKDVARLAAEKQIDLLIADEPLLTTRVYKDTALRPATHLDLLLRDEELDPFARALQSHGWECPSKHVLTFQHPSGPFAVLHGGLETELWERGEELAADGSSDRMLGRTDQLLRTCLGQSRLQLVNRLQWIADAKLLVESDSGTIDWELVNRTARSERSSLKLGDALSYVSGVVGAPVPDQVLERLASDSPSRRELLAHGIGRLDAPNRAKKAIPAGVRQALRRIIPR